MKTVEQSLRDRILYIGNEIPGGVANDKRSKFVILGAPQEVIDETRDAPPSPPDWVPSASEVLFMFGGWLTSRREILTCSRGHDASDMVRAISAFMDTNHLAEPRPGWEKHLHHPPEIPVCTCPDPANHATIAGSLGQEPNPENCAKKGEPI